MIPCNAFERGECFQIQRVQFASERMGIDIARIADGAEVLVDNDQLRLLSR